jgi:hypothetical protein
MKKLLTIAALMGVASLSYGQGSVNFSAGASASTRIATNSVAGGATTGQISGAGNYYFALFVAPSTTGTNYSLSASLDPTLSGFTFFGAYGTNTASVGRFTGNPTTDDVAVPGYGAGTSADFVVVGWQANIGTDWNSFRTWYNNGSPNDASHGSVVWAGHSFVAEGVQLGGGLIPPGTIFGAGTGQVPGFTLGAINVPEPSTIALAGLGAAAVVIFRRRKA